MLKSITRLGRQSSLYVLGDVMTQILGIILIPMYSHILTTEEYGLLGMASTVQKALVPILGLGVAGAVTRFYFDTKDERERRELVGGIWIGWLALLFGLTAIVVLIGTAFNDSLFKNVPFHPYILLAIGIAALNALATVPRALLRAQEKAGLFSLFSILNFAANAVLIIYLVAVLRQGAAGSLRGQFFGNLLVNLLYVVMMALYIQRAWNSQIFKAALIFGLPLIPHMLASWVLNFSDRWILERYVSLAEIGIYTLAYQFGQALGMITTSINRAWSPFFYEKIQEPDGPILIPRLITLYVLGLSWLGLAVSLLSRPVIFIIADPAYHSAYHIVPLIAAAYTVQGLYFIATNAILFTKQTNRLPLITGSAALANVGLNLWLIPRLGIQAAAINTLVGYLLLFLLAYFVSQRVFALTYDYRRILLGMAMALACYAMGQFIRLSSAWVELILRGFWVCAYPLFLLIFGLAKQEEIQQARRLARQIWTRRGKAVSPPSSTD